MSDRFPTPLPQPAKPLQPVGVKPLAPGKHEVAVKLPPVKSLSPWLMKPPSDHSGPAQFVPPPQP